MHIKIKFAKDENLQGGHLGPLLQAQNRILRRINNKEKFQTLLGVTGFGMTFICLYIIVKNLEYFAGILFFSQFIYSEKIIKN